MQSSLLIAIEYFPQSPISIYLSMKTANKHGWIIFRNYGFKYSFVIITFFCVNTFRKMHFFIGATCPLVHDKSLLRHRDQHSTSSNTRVCVKMWYDPWNDAIWSGCMIFSQQQVLSAEFFTGNSSSLLQVIMAHTHTHTHTHTHRTTSLLHEKGRKKGVK